MERGGGFEEDGSMEDAMAEQEELESRVSGICILDILCQIGCFSTLFNLGSCDQHLILTLAFPLAHSQT